MCTDVMHAENEEPFSSMMVDAKEKLKKYYNLTSEVYTVATVLDPALKLAYHKSTSGPDHLDAATVEQTVKEMKDKYGGSSSHRPSRQRSENALTSSGIWGEIFEDIEEGELAYAGDEVDAYNNSPRIAFKDDMLHWWAINECKYPVLATMARNFLAVPATSAPSERAFSLGRQVISTWRHSLEADTIQQIMCLKAWLKQVD